MCTACAFCADSNATPVSLTHRNQLRPIHCVTSALILPISIASTHGAHASAHEHMRRSVVDLENACAGGGVRQLVDSHFSLLSHQRLLHRWKITLASFSTHLFSARLFAAVSVPHFLKLPLQWNFSSSQIFEMAAGFNETLQWTMGLINASGKYLTAETFGFKLTANGANMKVKQIWTLETKAGDDQYVYLRSPHKRYLCANEKGEVSAASESMGDDERFIFLPQADGRCALKSPHGYYFGGSGDQLSCFTKTISETELWTVHLSMHPQINLRNVQRKCYAHLVGDELHVNEEVPWGADAMLTLEFNREKGRYLLLASNNKYLTRSGKLSDDISDDSMFQLEFHGSTIAFKDCAGKYLAGVGSKGVLQSRREMVEKDERFVLEDSHPQAVITAANGRVVSITRGTEVAASMSEEDAGDKETFQFEINKETHKWSVHAMNKNYWTSSSPTIQATAAQRDDSCWFDVAWKNEYITMQTASGKYVMMKPNGTLATTGEDPEDPKCQFVFTLINRPIIVLRGEYGFIQPKSGKTGRYDCNRSGYEVLTLNANHGAYTLSGANGKPWLMDEATKSFSADGTEPFVVYLELIRHTRMLIKCPNGSYLRGESNGLLAANGVGNDKETLWEY